MNILQAIILGVVQGLTEFLPVSSSAHLVFIQHFLGINQPEIVFEVVLHFATMLAIIIFFRQETGQLIQGMFRLNKFKTDPSARFSGLVILGSIPAVIIGLTGKNYFEAAFQSALLVAVFLLVTGVILYLAQIYARPRRGAQLTTIKDVLLIGVAQGLAILPGISRSGTTISAGILLGLEKKWAARFSFLLSLPAVLGATILELKDLSFNQLAGQKAVYFWGGVSAFIAGLFALKALLWTLEKGQFKVFAYYCWIVGGVVIFLLLR
ncbi:MAG: undecaprenyl-diphosphate phosphatase [Elusimicrobiota bacterium]